MTASAATSAVMICGGEDAPSQAHSPDGDDRSR